MSKVEKLASEIVNLNEKLEDKKIELAEILGIDIIKKINKTISRNSKKIFDENSSSNKKLADTKIIEKERKISRPKIKTNKRDKHIIKYLETNGPSTKDEIMNGLDPRINRMGLHMIIQRLTEEKGGKLHLVKNE